MELFLFFLKNESLQKNYRGNHTIGNLSKKNVIYAKVEYELVVVVVLLFSSFSHHCCFLHRYHRFFSFDLVVVFWQQPTIEVFFVAAFSVVVVFVVFVDYYGYDLDVVFVVVDVAAFYDYYLYMMVFDYSITVLYHNRDNMDNMLSVVKLMIRFQFL